MSWLGGGLQVWGRVRCCIGSHRRLEMSPVSSSVHGGEYSGVARNFSQGVRNSNCLQFSTDALHCFCRQRNFARWLLTPNASSLAALPQWKLDRSYADASWRIYDGDTLQLVAARTPSTFSTKNSASLSGLISVEADAGLWHVTRLKK